MTRLVGEEQREAEVIIKNATVYADGAQESLVYEVTLEAGQMPDAQMSSVSLFVDSSGSDDQCWSYSDSREDVMIMPCEDDWVLVCAPTYGYCMQAADIDAFTRITNLIEDGKYYITVRSRRLFVVTRPGEFCYPGTINPVDLYACLFGVSGVVNPAESGTP